MAKYIDAELFPRLYRMQTGEYGEDHVTNLVNALPDVREYGILIKEEKKSRKAIMREKLHNKNVKKILQDFLYEMETQPAWYGKMYGFEELEKHYQLFHRLMLECNIQTYPLASGYMYAKTKAKGNCSFTDTCPAKGKTLEELDDIFVREMEKTAQMISDLSGFSEEGLNFTVCKEEKPA